MPMPDGSNGNIKKVSIVGAGGDEPIVEPEPQTSNPQTGDNITFYIFVLINSVLGIIGTSYV